MTVTWLGDKCKVTNVINIWEFFFSLYYKKAVKVFVLPAQFRGLSVEQLKVGLPKNVSPNVVDIYKEAFC